MFYRFISENITSYINEGEHKAGRKNFDYAKLSDEEAEDARQSCINEKGFLFYQVNFLQCKKKAANDKNLNVILSKIFDLIESTSKGAESKENFDGLLSNIDLNSKNNLGADINKINQKLVQLLNGIGEINFDDYKNNDIDAFGDAYEYLMGMYASNAGKSGGEFFTPQEVSELLAKIAIGAKTSVNYVYDPACGSGSLLLKFAKILGKDNVKFFYGQEINSTTFNLCRMNMLLHDIPSDHFKIICDDTLTRPYQYDEKIHFEAIVSNPPYSIKWVGSDNAILVNDERFSPAGILAPKSKADFAFVMHSLYYLSESGTAAIVCFPGILYRGGAEQKIRKYLVDNGFIDCIIQLPEKLFYGTSIATCIMVLKKIENW